ADAGKDVERLPGRVRVPGRARSRLEVHHARPHIARRWRVDNRILPDGTAEILGWRAARRGRARRSYLHVCFLSLLVPAHSRASRTPGRVQTVPAFAGTSGLQIATRNIIEIRRRYAASHEADIGSTRAPLLAVSAAVLCPPYRGVPQEGRSADP